MFSAGPCLSALLNPSALPYLLSQTGLLSAAFAHDGDAIEAGRIYMAPPDHHMVLGSVSIRLNQGPKVHYTRPAVDPLYISAAEACCAANGMRNGRQSG